MAVRWILGLLDAVDRLLNASDEGLAVLAVLDVAGRLSAVHDLAFKERALQVSCHQVDAADLTSVPGGDGEESPSRGVPEGRRKGLIVVDACLEGTSRLPS